MERYKILSTTDGKYIGFEVDSDLRTLTLPSGEEFHIDGRMKLLDGSWKVWNANYILEIREVEV